MKNLFASLLVLFLAVAIIQPQAQTKITKGFSVVEDLGTMANSGQETAYLDLREWKTLDSVVVSLSAKGEIDIDTCNFYVGNYTNDGFIMDATAGVLYQAVTIDLAAAATDFLLLTTSNATKLTGTALRGVTGIKAVIEGASSGNDATDPNALYICWRIYGTK